MNWKPLPPEKYSGMREVLAEGKHPAHGEFKIARDVFSGGLWVQIESIDGTEDEFFSITLQDVMDDFFVQLSKIRGD